MASIRTAFFSSLVVTALLWCCSSALANSGGAGLSGYKNAKARQTKVLDPIPGFSLGRDDAGVDASARSGARIYAPAASKLVQVLSDWYAGQPLLLFRFVNKPSGAWSSYWYVAEQVRPATTRIGSTFQAGARVGTFASSGTGIEIGWGSATSNSRTYAQQRGDYGAANPPYGARTRWGESFKKFFGIR